jgi:hypothetical protein
MGWGGGDRVFDPMVKAILSVKELKDRDKGQLIKTLLLTLEQEDWDTQDESRYWTHPLVEQAAKKIHPDWFEEEEE